MSPNFTRRDFIKAGTIATIGGLTFHPSVSMFDTTDKKYPLTKKSLKYGMIEEEISIMDKFKLIKSLGFDGVEPNVPNDLDKKEILMAQDAAGIEIPGVVNSAHWKYPLSHPDPKVRKQCAEATRTALRDCKEFGGTTVLLVAGVVNEEITYQQCYDRTVSEIKKLIPVIEQTGIKLAIENVWNNFLLSPIEAAQFIDEIDHPLIGWYFDVGNILRYGWPDHWIETLGERIFKIDIKDYSKQKMNEEGLWAGFDIKLTEGSVDWKKVNHALASVGYEGWGSAEVKGGNKERLAEISGLMDRIYADV